MANQLELISGNGNAITLECSIVVAADNVNESDPVFVLTPLITHSYGILIIRILKTVIFSA